jgi:hypothetical protein
MKKALLPAAIFALLVAAPGLRAQLLTNFGNNATDGGSWTYTPGTSTISGTEGIGDSIFGTPLNFNLGANRFLQLSGNASTAPAGSFTITIEDNLGHTAIAHYVWTQFVGGSTQNKPIEFTTFNFNNVVGWSLDSGGSLESVVASFSQLRAVAVPESSAWAACTAGLLAAWIGRRELRKRRLVAIRIRC